MPLHLLPAAGLPTRSAPRPSFIQAAGRFDLEAIMRFAHAEARANVARAAARGVVRRYAAAFKLALADAWDTARAQRFCHERDAASAALPAAHSAILVERTAALMGIDSDRRMVAEVAMLDSILDVVSKVEGMSFEDAKVRACEMIARPDLVLTKGGKGQKTDPASLLSPPAALQAPDLPRAYLASRLGVEPADVPMPDTRAVGWSGLPYVEASTKGTKTTFNEVAKPPCTVWETVSSSGLRHAHRIYTAAAGQGKASLGTTSDGRARAPKKSASAPKDGPSTAGCSVMWGSPTTAERAIVAEGIETAAAVALAFKAEIAAGTVVVAAAIAANGVAAWTPYGAEAEGQGR